MLGSRPSYCKPHQQRVQLPALFQKIEVVQQIDRRNEDSPARRDLHETIVFQSSETDEIINLYKSGHSNNEIAMEIKISI